MIHRIIGLSLIAISIVGYGIDLVAESTGLWQSDGLGYLMVMMLAGGISYLFQQLVAERKAHTQSIKDLLEIHRDEVDKAHGERIIAQRQLIEECRNHCIVRENACQKGQTPTDSDFSPSKAENVKPQC